MALVSCHNITIFSINVKAFLIYQSRSRIEEVKNLDPKLVRFDDTTVDNVESNITNTIREIFGQNSHEYNEHSHHKIWHGGYAMGESENVLQSKFAAGIPQTIKMLEGLISRLDEKKEVIVDSPEIKSTTEIKTFESRKVFIVHGHDNASKEMIARYLTKLDLTPVILHELPNESKTIIEKFEKHADVDFAIIILSPDDIGYSIDTENEKNYRARQNVIFELGYFIAKIGRERVCALYKGNIELPSDYQGILYIPLDEGQGWRLSVAREIKQVGIKIDLNLAI